MFQKGFENGSPNSWERPDQWGDGLSSPQADKGLAKVLWELLEACGTGEESGMGQRKDGERTCASFKAIGAGHRSLPADWTHR